MKFGLYSIRDNKTDVFGTPFTSHNNGSAIRTFGDVAADPQTNINKHPEDFVLIRVGSWDDDSGQATYEPHITLSHATDFQHAITETPSG